MDFKIETLSPQETKKSNRVVNIRCEFITVSKTSLKNLFICFNSIINQFVELFAKKKSHKCNDTGYHCICEIFFDMSKMSEAGMYARNTAKVKCCPIDK